MGEPRVFVNYLLKDELSFELLIRGVDSTGLKVDDRRKLLRTQLRLEGSDPSLSKGYARVELDTPSELDICGSKLETLVSLIDEFRLKPLTSEYNKLYTRVMHVLTRVKYVPVAENIKETISKIESCCSNLLDSLSSIFENPEIHYNDLAVAMERSILSVQEGASMPPGDGVDVFVQNDGEHQESTRVDKKDTDAHASTPASPSHEQEPAFVSRVRNLNFHPRPSVILAHNQPVMPGTSVPSVPVVKWNLKFCGDATRMGLNCFLERVEELQIARNVSDGQLLSSAVDLFEGQALIWFRSIRNRVHGWPELVKQLRLNFLPLDYDEELWSEIRARKQGSDEKPNLYVAVMINMFNRLTGSVADQDRLKYILKNLHPYYASHLSLVPITSIDELITYCRRLEETKVQNSKYRSGSNADSPPLEPDLAYRQPNTPQKRNVHSISRRDSSTGDQPDSREVARQSSREPQRGFRTESRVMCWNCRTSGHSFRNCSANRTLFCYNCGTPDVVSPSCPRCSGSKNVQARACPSRVQDPPSQN